MQKIDIRIPYRPGAKLGEEYNHIMSETNCEWVLFLDHDIFLCNPHWYTLCQEAIKQEPKAGLFTCWTNNIGRTMQKAEDCPVSTDIKEHTNYAKAIFEKYQYSITEIDRASGMFLLINKTAWQKVGGFLGEGIFKEDWNFSKRLRKITAKLYRIDGLYVYHRRDRQVGSWIKGEKTTKELRDERYAKK